MNTVNNSNIRLLLVKGDRISRSACKYALIQYQGCNFEILEAETGAQGLKLARARQPDCILLDYYLPDLNGAEFLTELAKETGGLPMPVVMLAEQDNAVDTVDALKLGASGYVVKDQDWESMQWLPALVFRTLHGQQAIKDKTEALDRLRIAEAKYRNLVEQIPAITYIASLESPGKLLYLSPQIHKLGFSPEDWLDDPQGLLSRVHPDDRLDAMDAYSHSCEYHAPLRCEYRLVMSDGQSRWFLDEANVVRDQEGGSLFLQGVLVDITKDKQTEQELSYYRRRLEEMVALRTEQLEKQCVILKSANANLDQALCELKQADSALRTREQHFRLLLESAGDGILGFDAEGCCTFVNRAALSMLGYTQEELLGQDKLEMIHPGCSDVLPAQAEQWGVYRAFRDGVPQRSVEIFRSKDGRSFPVECSYYPMELNGLVDGAVLVFRDVTESQALMQSLSYQASHDGLTGLINRTEFERRAAGALHSAHENKSEHVLCYLDLDQFKVVNDTCGHAAGDELLRALSKLWQSKLRQRDTLARLGGDEFALLLEHCTLEQARSITSELSESVRNFDFTWKGKAFPVSVSIGITELTSADKDISAVLGAADAACYKSKKKKRNQVHVFKSYGRVHRAIRAKGMSGASHMFFE
ncbi:MAG: diguanylate cyclase domain-containing protein [Methylobacter sp.]